MRLGILMAALALVAGMLLPGAAAADDRSLREAGRSHDSQFRKLGRETRRAARIFARSEFKRGARRLLRAQKATRREIKKWTPKVKREQPSSPDGATYKRLLLQAGREFDRGLRWDIRSVRSYARGRLRTGIRYGNRAIKYYRRSQRHEKQALRAIKRALG